MRSASQYATLIVSLASQESGLETLSNGAFLTYILQASVEQMWYLHRHVDGHDYMYALSEMLDSAKECIFILVRSSTHVINLLIIDVSGRTGG